MVYSINQGTHARYGFDNGRIAIFVSAAYRGKTIILLGVFLAYKIFSVFIKGCEMLCARQTFYMFVTTASFLPFIAPINAGFAPFS